MNVVILCGGSGTRLWPVSKRTSPKQFAKIFNNESLFQKTIARNTAYADRYSVIVNTEQMQLCLEQIPNNINSTVLVEPVGRNTAPAAALAAFASSPNEILLVVPSDHLIDDNSTFMSCMQNAKLLAEKNNIVTFGIKPKFPETGYGYIEADGNNLVSFKEKPNIEMAIEYLANGNYYWNSGIFCFKASVFLNELKKYSPNIYAQTLKTYESRVTENNIISFNARDMQEIPSDSIDYAVMEKTKIGKVIPSPINWSDMGSFDSLYEHMPKDEKGNTLNQTNGHVINSSNNLIISQNQNINLIDVNDLIIVEYNGKILITKRGHGQRVKNLVEMIKESKPSDL